MGLEQGPVLSRFDADMTAAGEARVEVNELLVELGSGLSPGSERFWAMAQYLSGGEGWRDAGTLLRGTFAGFVAATAQASGLTDGQEG